MNGRSRTLAVLASLAMTSLAAVGLAMSTGSCASSPDPGRFTQILTPPFDQFKSSVSGFIERRCGTLDCHGQVGRPLRIYGGRGLRILDDGGHAPGNPGATTDAEVVANFQAVVGLEPELMSQVVADPGNFPPTRLLLLKKPRALERHKGGLVINQGDDADRCITSWVLGQVDTKSCETATAVP